MNAVTPLDPKGLTSEEEASLWVGATRYYLGRATYAVSDFTVTLAKAWPTLQPKTQDLIRHSVEEAFTRDNNLRSLREGQNPPSYNSYLPLGHDCDRRAWETVRNLWPKSSPEEETEWNTNQVLD